MEILSFILIGISCLSILITLIVLILNILGKLKSKTESNGKKSFFWIFPFILLIFLSFGLIVGVLLTKVDMIEQNMDDIINDTNSVIESARQGLDKVELWELKLSATFIGSTFSDSLLDFNNITEFAAIKGIINDYGFMLEDNSAYMTTFKLWIKEFKGVFPSACGGMTDVGERYIDNRLEDFKTTNRVLIDDIRETDSKLFTLVTDLIKKTREQETLDFGRNRIENDLNTMKLMLDHFQGDVNSTDETRQEWIRKMIELAPDKQLIAKVIVTITSVTLILVSLVMITAFIAPKSFGRRFSSISIVSSLCITGLLVIGISATSIAFSFGLLGYFDCPLAKGPFGLSNFTTPVTGQETLPICRPFDASKFFAGLTNYNSITTESIAQSLNIEVYKKKLLDVLRGSMYLIRLPEQWVEKLDKINESFTKLDEFYNKNCLDAKQQTKLSEYHVWMRQVLDESTGFQNLIDKFNENVMNPKRYFPPLLDRVYITIVELLNDSIRKIQQKITDSDFSCNLVTASYSKIGQSICKQVDPPLDPFYIYLIIIILASLSSLILQTVVYVHLRNVTPDGEQSKSHSQTPTALST